MPTVQIKAQLSFDELVKAVEQFNLSELERFVFRVLARQRQRQAACLPYCEYTADVIHTVQDTVIIP
jgi:hypothetical protein